MPTYEYTCSKCGKRFTAILGIAEHEKKKPACPKCGSRAVAQRFSAFTAKTSRKS